MRHPKKIAGDIHLHPEDYGRAQRAAQIVGMSLDEFITLAIHSFSRGVLNGMIPGNAQSAAHLSHGRECANAAPGVSVPR